MVEDAKTSEMKLEEEILADARRKADKIVERARRETEKILAQAEKSAEEEAAKIIAHFKERADKQRSIILATVDIEIKKRRLAREDRKVRSIIDEAKKRLFDKQSYDYKRALVNLATDAIRKMQGNDFVICLGKSDGNVAHDSLLSAIKSGVEDRAINLKFDSSPLLITGGILVKSADGRQYYDNSFDARLKRLQDYLRKFVADIIFEKKQ